ncbi:hypothetical protein [Limimaricola sp.]|uniref:hypothetical protein n=1 Tax=Limimaricola sp. TaxID=2211665 RepID=UPI004059157E
MSHETSGSTRSLEPDRLRDGRALSIETMTEAEFGLFSDIWRSVRYHRAREAFFQQWSSGIAFTSLLAATSAVTSLLANAPMAWSIAAGLAVAFAQAIELIGRPGEKARLHSGLAAEFSALERIATVSEELSPKEIREMRGDILNIESREPPIKRFLDLRCHNEVARAIGSDDIEPLSCWQRWFVHYHGGYPAG